MARLDLSVKTLFQGIVKPAPPATHPPLASPCVEKPLLGEMVLGVTGCRKHHRCSALEGLERMVVPGQGVRENGGSGAVRAGEWWARGESGGASSVAYGIAQELGRAGLPLQGGRVLVMVLTSPV